MAGLPSLGVGLDTVAWMVLPLIHATLAASHAVADGRAGFANLAHGGFFALGAYGFALGLDQDRGPQTAVILAVLLPVAVGRSSPRGYCSCGTPAPSRSRRSSSSWPCGSSR
ncbi:MAG: hypothetical protein WEG40_19625 [Candidatus Rokuibacteriota bacterium]